MRMKKTVDTVLEKEWLLDLTSAVAEAVIPLKHSGDLFKLTILATAILLNIRERPCGTEVPNAVTERLNELVRSEQFDEAQELVRRLGLPRGDEAAAIHEIDEIRDRLATIRRWNNHLSALLRQAEFEGAVRFVQSLNLPQKNKDEVVRRVRELERNYGETIIRMQQWNEHFNSLLRQGDFDGAVRFIQSLDLPWRKKDEIIGRIDEIRQVEREHREAMAKSQKWNDELSTRLQREDYDSAARWVQASDLPREEKDKLVSHIYENERLHREQRTRTEEWYSELVYLLGARKDREARKYVRSLPINIDDQEALYQRAREAMGLHLQ